MNKLNHLGEELIELKKELSKPQNSIISKSLSRMVDELLQQELIDEMTFQNLQNEAFTVEEFEKFCLTRENYCIDKKTLLEMYEEKRLELVENLNKSVEEFKLTSRSFPTEEEVIIIKPFLFTRETACEYFGLIEESCDKVYGRKKFVEHFLALRYKKVLSEFVVNYPLGEVPFYISHTPLIYDEELESYVMEFLIRFKLETLETLDVDTALVEKINQLLRDVIRYVNHSLGLNKPRLVIESNKQKNKKQSPIKGQQKTLPKQTPEVKEVESTKEKPSTPKPLTNPTLEEKKVTKETKGTSVQSETKEKETSSENKTLPQSLKPSKSEKNSTYSDIEQNFGNE